MTISDDRIKELRGLLGHLDRHPDRAWLNSEDRSDLLSILSDYSTLKAENERLRAENLELGAELTSMLNDEIADGFDRNDIEKLQARAEKAEAQLAKVAPLIQAVMGAKHLPGIINNLEFLVTKFTKFYPGAPEELAILRAALALREGEK